MKLPIDSSEVVELQKNLEKFDKSYLVTLCDFIINQYILNNGAGYTEELDEAYRESKASEGPAHTFPEFIKDLQRRFNYPELQRFSVEAEKVFLSINNQKIQINGNQVQNIPRTTPPVNEDRDFFSRHATEDPGSSEPESNTEGPNSNPADNNGNNRFGSLEFDE